MLLVILHAMDLPGLLTTVFIIFGSDALFSYYKPIPNHLFLFFLHSQLRKLKFICWLAVICIIVDKYILAIYRHCKLTVCS